MAPLAPRSCVFAASLLLALWTTDACIYLYGNAKDSLAAPPTGTKWNHGFLGDDWVDSAWSCKTGTHQSPINIVSTSPRDAIWEALNVDVSTVPQQLMTHWNYPPLVSNGSNVKVINTGHTIQVEWDTTTYGAEVTIAAPATPNNSTTVTSVLDMTDASAVTRVPIVPLQFHFHAHSEHMLEDTSYPLEMHIVHKVTDPKLPGCAAGCFSVTGIMFEIDPLGTNNTALDAIWKYMPTREGDMKTLPAGASIPLASLLPASASRDYVTYSGSLTTPPCSEGLLWHVMTHVRKISLAQWRQYMTAVGVKDCTSGSKAKCTVAGYGWNYRLPQPINERKIRLAQQGCDQ